MDIDPREFNLHKIAYSPNEVMALTGVSRTSFYAWVRNGELPLAHFGTRSLVLAPDLARLLQQMRSHGVRSRPETPEELARRLAREQSGEVIAHAPTSRFTCRKADERV
jgi:hypothetical protein